MCIEITPIVGKYTCTNTANEKRKKNGFLQNVCLNLNRKSVHALNQ